MGKAIMIYIALWIGTTAYCTAQQLNSSNKKAQAAYQTASGFLRGNQYEQAAKSLEEAVSYDSNFAAAYQQLGDIYRRLANYPKAIEAYRRVLAINPNLTSATHFGIGESYLFQGTYIEAANHLNKYLATGTPSEKNSALTEKYLKDAHFATQRQSTLVANMHLMPNVINTANDEYFPQLTADNQTIIFTRKEENQENFYESTLEDGNWTPSQKLQGDINSETFNEGAHCISPDGKYLFFTGCNRPNGLGSCDIYVSKKEDERWSAPYNIGAPINTRGWEAQPSISADGKTLYFVSNRAGGHGGYDIWKSKLKEDGTWDEPTNLGPSINTPYNEGAPYIHADNRTLFFSSDGWPGFGRKDIFKSHLDVDNQWSTPENLGYPVNNQYEQLSMHVSMDGQIAHIASQTNGEQLDIYRFTLPAIAQPHPVAFIRGKVFDANSEAPLSARVSVTDPQNDSIVFDDISDYADGEFLATLPVGRGYAVHIQKEGYLFESIPYSAEDLEAHNHEIERRIALQPIETGSITALNNIYFALNKAELLPPSWSELAILIDFLQINPRVSIELSGHTDSTGNKGSNQLLSENRAKAVMNYLIDKGIAAQRLKAVGYGDSQPIADNDTEEGRQRNRRTQVRILHTN